MIHPADDRSQCLDRARMHDQLAASTNDLAARQVHQAMAAEFRRRADRLSDESMPIPHDHGPLLEVAPALR